MVSFRHTLLGCGALASLMLAACSRESPDEMSWGRAALERNSRLEVVAADRDTHTFTVRLKDSGELRMVRMDQLVAAPPAVLAAATAAPEQAPAAAGSAAKSAPSGGNSGAGSGATGVAGVFAGPPPAAGAPGTSAQPATLAPQTGPTIESAPGRVLSAGPGYTIKAAPSSSGTGGGRDSAVAAGAPLERRHEPIVCQGSRLLHIDNRNLLSDGDAVSAEDGCEVYITNSRIRAARVAVSARRANVHIDNSLIEGDEASIEASEGAQVYAGATRFKGLSRRLDSAAFHDLGGNVWN